MIAAAWPLVRPLLFLLDPERAHHLVLDLLERMPPALQRGLGAPPAPTGPWSLFGRPLGSPIGLAAGLDKDARALPAWQHLGFGFVEIGTVTPRPQPGNPPPRIARLPRERALVNRMGFPSEGVEAVARRLESFRERGRWPAIPVGANLGKNKTTPPEEAPRDYATLAARLGPLVDYLVVNVSSPNTPGLRELQLTRPLSAIVRATVEAAGKVPVAVKLSPDLDDDALEAAVETALEAGARGFIATNTTRSRPTEASRRHPEGGYSGPALHPLARRCILKVLEVTAGRVPVIGVGGIHRPEQVADLLDRGCAAVQVYTALVYEGPGLPRRLAAGRLSGETTGWPA